MSLLLLGVIVSGCDIVRVGMGWVGAVLDVGCSGAIAWSNFPFLEENSDSADTNRSKQKEGSSGEQVIYRGLYISVFGE